MSAPLEVDFESLGQGASDIRTAVHDAEAQIQKVRKECEDLVQVAWHGHASQAFNELMIQYNKHATDLNEALDGIGQLIDKVSANHSNTDQDQSTVVSNVMADLQIPTVTPLSA
ncbi:hypothetical protein Afil01_66070 [Actinorhabdospora filicis]|uniref:ESAT-6-like protein n=1 Tax=Actinorhabdospora filicis TaxID=1785913 RepID=A0A9W6WEE6_9ACTN|nr:WXG100 family type VII secretion target [Actinorhabdospora filicis]GLZ81800.1 hypothetical protein Afil01_66070 [Actinorhabdospora filicis]